MTDAPLFLIWSIEHDAWWRPQSLGYTRTLSEAGRYTRHEAEQILRRANLILTYECLIPVSAVSAAPEDGADPRGWKGNEG